jgi:Protein of unknown function (DUF1194)
MTHVSATCKALALAASVTTIPAAAFGQDYVDLELVLAIDISRSMDLDELGLQRQGYVEAFRHPEVIRAIEAGTNGRIAVTYVEWAGSAYQSVLVPWSIISNQAEAEAFAARIGAAPLERERGTSISQGLDFAAGLFASSGASGLRRAIDVSGDGPNNVGLPVAPMRDRVVADGITINGLPIMLKTVVAAGPYNIPNLDIYYEDCVIGGPGAFVVTVDDPARFVVAIRRKLVLEIAGAAPQSPPREAGARVVPVADARPVPRVDCLVGEKARSRWLYQN